MIEAPFLPKPPQPATRGRNWHFAKTGRLGVAYEEALDLCERSGERVPSPDDLESLDPPFPGGTPVWLEKPPDAQHLIALNQEGEIAHMIGAAGRIAALERRLLPTLKHSTSGGTDASLMRPEPATGRGGTRRAFLRMHQARQAGVMVDNPPRSGVGAAQPAGLLRPARSDED